MSHRLDTLPDFTNAPAASRQRLQLCRTGPGLRIRDLGPDNHFFQRYGFQVEDCPFHTSNKTAIMLHPTPPAEHLVGLGGLGDVEVAVHYRFLDPDGVMSLLNPGQTSIIDPAYAATASDTNAPANPAQHIAAQETLLAGNTKVSLPRDADNPNTRHKKSENIERIIRAAASAADLNYDFDINTRGNRWACAVYGECGMLSLRMDDANWERIAHALLNGSWWVRIYLVEVNPRVDGKWITQKQIVREPPAIPNANTDANSGAQMRQIASDAWSIPW